MTWMVRVDLVEFPPSSEEHLAARESFYVPDVPLPTPSARDLYEIVKKAAAEWCKNPRPRDA